MAGDLEDFLRRAAARRQQKANQQRQQEPPRREPPQYSDRRTERVVRSGELDEPVLVAELVQDDTNSYSAQLQRVEQAKRAAAEALQKAKQSGQQLRPGQTKRRSGGTATTTNPARKLIEMLKQPGGIQQAILLQEIFDRPEHRW